MPLYKHKSGEQVLVPEDHPEALRLAASDGWVEVPERKPRARAPRTRAGATTAEDQEPQNEAQDSQGSDEPADPAAD